MLSYLLRRLKEVAQATLGEAVIGCVIGVPAHFDYGQKEAVRQVARELDAITDQFLNRARRFLDQQFDHERIRQAIAIAVGIGEVLLPAIFGIDGA